MSKRQKKQSSLVGEATGARQKDPAAAAPRPLSRGKLWAFRLITLALAPVVFVGLLEIGLRVTGYGQATAFVLPRSQHGREVFVQNNQFGWRFFGPRMARLPDAFSISRDKAPGAVRILVFGESAAKGEPQPAFGMPRLLEAVLSLRHPGTRFEVVNCAMTAINSHAVLPIVRDCVKLDADIWVVYMGNNEVVGPFGAGTVFGQQQLPLWLIRATLALRATRIGQLLDAAVQSSSRESGEWGGMKMFLDQQVREDDPRMADVYEHFQRNLADILREGQRCSAGIVVSTVAVNLRDCAPFGSAHRAGRSAADQAKWEQLYALGITAQTNSNFVQAAVHFTGAAQLDDSFAELRFRQGQCALALNQAGEARVHFQAARDGDTLRFRCDRRLNALIRQSISNREAERIRIVDAERVFAEASQDGLPGTNLFYEHVHPTFAGNYLLARNLAEQVEKLLPDKFAALSATSRPWPSVEDCAKRLAWTEWTLQGVLQDVLARVKSPPFTAQVNHEVQLQSLTTALEGLAPALQPAGVERARLACETALAAAPDDPVLLGFLSSLKQSAGDFAGATVHAQRRVEVLPSDGQAWLQYGLVLVRQQSITEAVGAFQQATELDPMDIVHRQNLAQSLWQLGRRDEATAHYRRTVKLQPNFAIGWLSLGQILEETGHAREAEKCFQQALNCRTIRPTDLTTLARFCRSRSWHSGALSNYASAIRMTPGDAKLRVEAGEHLLTQRRHEEAFRCFEAAVQLAPELVSARQLYGTMLGQAGNAAGAEQQFREVLRLAPDHLEARLNLGISLMSQGRTVEAQTCLEEVLLRSPTNALAQQYIRILRPQIKAEN